MCGATELGLEIDDGEGDSEKVDGVASPSQPTKNRSRAEPGLTGVPTYPEKKRHHCVKVRPLRTCSRGLARSVFSLFGTRFRRK